jgi:hypothetical protein
MLIEIGNGNDIGKFHYYFLKIVERQQLIFERIYIEMDYNISTLER